MNNIVLMYQPFDKLQNIALYENGEVTQQAFVENDRVIETINGFTNLCRECDVNLVGNAEMLSVFQNGLMTKFSQENKNISVNITNR